MLIPAKLTASVRLHHSIKRDRLLQQLNETHHYPLVLINAPAGYGKTTLISQWAQGKTNLGWYVLDESDNQTERFATYFCAALMKAMQTDKNTSEQEKIRHTNLQALFEFLLVKLSQFQEHLYLVIDDYHLIDNQEIHDALKYWLRHQPENMTLIIISRTTPPLGITGLRVQESLLEINVHQLPFDHQETVRFFQNRLNHDIPYSEMTALCDAVEGWPTALQLISLVAKQHQISLQEATHRFTHLNNSHIYEYLNDEVFNKLEDETRHFLLQCSILHSMNKKLVQNLTGIADSQRKLEELEKQGLFLQQIDTDEHWWRFHPLVASFLWQCCQTELTAEIPLLHQRAAESWLNLGYSTEALYHAMQLDNNATLLIILKQYAWRLFHNGEFKLLEQSLVKLNSDEFIQQPDLVLLKAWLAQSQHRHHEVQKIFTDFEQILKDHNVQINPAYQAEFNVLRAQVAINDGDDHTALTLATASLNELAENFYYARTVATSIIGEAYHVRGELNTALIWRQKAEQMARTHHTYHNILWAMLQQSEILLAQGFLQSAYDMLEKANQFVKENGLQKVPMYEFLLRTKGRILWEWYQLDKAEAMANAGTAVLDKAEDKLQCLVLLSKISLVRGDVDNASRILKEIDELQYMRTYHFDWRANFDNARTILWQMKQNQQAAQTWLHQSWQPTTYCNHFSQEQWRNIARTNILLGNFNEALKILNCLIQTASELKLNSDLNHNLILRNRLYFLQNEKALAQKDLIAALKIAHQTSFISAFVLEGEIMAQQMRQLLQLNILDEFTLHKAQFILRNINQYYRHKFAHFDEAFVTKLLSNPKVPELLRISPLTQREWQVLGLIYSGYSNEQIATELQVATTTTKTHIRNLYQKINVANRTEAIEYTKSLLQLMGYK